MDQTLISAATVADNLNMAIYFMILIAFAGSAWLRKHYPHPHIDHVLAHGTDAEEGKTLAAKYWGRKEISLRDIAIDFAFSIIVVTISKAIAGVLSTAIPTGNWFLNMLNTFFGSQYVWITTVAMLFATVLPEKA